MVVALISVNVTTDEFSVRVTKITSRIGVSNTSNASTCSTMAFPPLANRNHVVSVFIDFPINSKQDAPFYLIDYDYFCADWDAICDHLRDTPWKDIFTISASAAASKFGEWVQVGIDAYIPHHKY